MSFPSFRSIAHYEIKTLTRKWSFRFIVLIAVIFTAGLQLTAQSNLSSPSWSVISLISSFPFANAYIVNYLQVIIIVLLSGGFLYREQKLDTLSSIQVHDFNNIKYLLGKTSGTLIVLFCLDFVLTGISLFIHLFASDSPFALWPYIFYFSTLTLPTLIFITGLTIFLKSIIHNQALSFIILLAFLYIEIMHGNQFFHGAFDLFATSLPNAFSEWTGFSGLNLYLLQRMTFLLWGCGLFILGAAFFQRIPNIPHHPIKYKKAGIILLLVGILPAGSFFYSIHLEISKRALYREIFAKYEEIPKIQINKHHITFEQKEKSYIAKSQLTILNPSDKPLDSFILYLNPGLEIISLTHNSHSLTYRRDHQVINIYLPLSPQQEQNIQVKYKGKIVPEISYPEIKDLSSQDIARSHSFFRFGKETHFLQKKFTLLTPENLWYPTSLPPVNVLSPLTTTETFIDFSLDVVGEKERLPVSQGISNTSNDTVHFTNRKKLPSLSLCIGNYSRKSVLIDSCLYELYLFKGHEFMTDGYDSPQDFIANMYKQIREYKFDKLAMVETPVHFCAYSREWKKGSEYVQPEIIFRPEREALLARPIHMKPKQEEDVIYVSPYQSAFGTTRFIRPENLFIKISSRKKPWIQLKNEYDLSSLQNFNFHISSIDFQGINLIFQTFRQQQNPEDFVTEPTTNPIILEYLKKHSLEKALQDTAISPFLNDILKAKANILLKRLLCDIPYDKFYSFTRDFVQRNLFKTVSFEQYGQEFQQQFGLDLIACTRKLYKENRLPVFLIKNIQIENVEQAGKIGHIRSLNVWNKGEVDGVISISGYCYSRYYAAQPELYVIPAGTSKEIRSWFPGDCPKDITVRLHTNLSQNIPANYNFSRIPITSSSRVITGIFDTDTITFCPKANEFIVDNNDPGFHLVEPNNLLQKLTKKKHVIAIQSPYEFPVKWTPYIHENAYGDIIRSYYCKKSGTGETRVEWETQLPTEGKYELFVYNNEFGGELGIKPHRIGDPEEEEQEKNPTQTYIFSHREGEEKVILEINNVGSGWISLGKYTCPAGKAKITLLDTGAYPDQLIFADAVKWVKLP